MKMPDTTTLIVADTSGLMSLLIDTDANHEKALLLSELFDERFGAVVISPHVFSELINVVGKKLGHKVAVSAGKQILTNPSYLILESDTDLEKALTRLTTQPESVSFTDCIVMTLADRFQTKLIFGFDNTFAKNGYRLPEAVSTQDAA